MSTYIQFNNNHPFVPVSFALHECLDNQSLVLLGCTSRKMRTLMLENKNRWRAALKVAEIPFTETDDPYKVYHAKVLNPKNPIEMRIKAAFEAGRKQGTKGYMSISFATIMIPICNIGIFYGENWANHKLGEIGRHQSYMETLPKDFCLPIERSNIFFNENFHNFVIAHIFMSIIYNKDYNEFRRERRFSGPWRIVSLANSYQCFSFVHSLYQAGFPITSTAIATLFALKVFESLLSPETMAAGTGRLIGHAKVVKIKIEITAARIRRKNPCHSFTNLFRRMIGFFYKK